MGFLDPAAMMMQAALAARAQAAGGSGTGDALMGATPQAATAAAAAVAAAAAPSPRGNVATYPTMNHLMSTTPTAAGLPNGYGGFGSMLSSQSMLDQSTMQMLMLRSMMAQQAAMIPPQSAATSPQWNMGQSLQNSGYPPVSGYGAMSNLANMMMMGNPVSARCCVQPPPCLENASPLPSRYSYSVCARPKVFLMSVCQAHIFCQLSSTRRK